MTATQTLFVVEFTTEVQNGFKADGSPNRVVSKSYYSGTLGLWKSMKPPVSHKENANHYKTRKGAEKAAKFIRETFSYKASEVGVAAYELK